MSNTKLHLYDDDDGLIAVLCPEGSDVLIERGFGLFFENWQEGEFTITENAKKILLESCVERSGLNPMEFFGGPDATKKEQNILGFCQPFAKPEEISCPQDAKDWIRDLPIEEIS